MAKLSATTKATLKATKAALAQARQLDQELELLRARQEQLAIAKNMLKSLKEEFRATKKSK